MDIYQVGETIRRTLQVRNAAGGLADATGTPTITIYNPAGTADITAQAATQDAGDTGNYYYDWASTAKTSGAYLVKWSYVAVSATLLEWDYFELEDPTKPNVAASVLTIADQIRSEIDANPDAGGGRIPDRIRRRVRQLGSRMWNLQDWLFRRTPGTLTLEAGETEADMPDDFKELDHRVMRATETGSYRLLWTQDAALWQRAKDLMGHGAGAGIPRFALLYYDEAWIARFWPEAEADHDYDYWYVKADPWQGAAPIADNIALSPTHWPVDFDEGWLQLCRVELLKGYRTDDSWKDHVSAWKAWRQQVEEENNEYLSQGVEPIEDVMGDWGATARACQFLEPIGGIIQWYGST